MGGGGGRECGIILSNPKISNIENNSTITYFRPRM